MKQLSPILNQRELYCRPALTGDTVKKTLQLNNSILSGQTG